VKAGDLVLCHGTGLVSRSIRWAQRNLENTEYSEWNHVAVLDREVDGVWYVIQADSAGVTDTRPLDTITPGGRYEIVELPSCVDRELFLAFLRSQVGSKYGFLTIASCAFDMWLPDAICLRRNGTWICSGLVAGALWFAGFEQALLWGDLYTVTPAEIAQAILGL
jgi:hypothetical protein